jgi:hypothetical protein
MGRANAGGHATGHHIDLSIQNISNLKKNRSEELGKPDAFDCMGRVFVYVLDCMGLCWR